MTTTWRVFPNSPCVGWKRQTRVPCSRRCYRANSINEPKRSSSQNRVATHWRCSNCTAHSPQPSWPVDTVWRKRNRPRVESSGRLAGACTTSPRKREHCYSSRRLNHPGNHRGCGPRPIISISAPMPRRPRKPPGSSQSTGRSVSVIRSSGRRSTPTHRYRSDGRRTARWPRRSRVKQQKTTVPGTSHTLRPGPTNRSPKGWFSPPKERVLVAASQQPPRSCRTPWI
jgi:hypothetical protein